MDPLVLTNLMRALQDVDFGYIDVADESVREDELEFLEAVVDRLNAIGLDFPEGELAIRFFLSDPKRARSYLYGPTDIQDGVGLIEKLKKMILAEENDQY